MTAKKTQKKSTKTQKNPLEKLFKGLDPKALDVYTACLNHPKRNSLEFDEIKDMFFGRIRRVRLCLILNQLAALHLCLRIRIKTQSKGARMVFCGVTNRFFDHIATEEEEQEILEKLTNRSRRRSYERLVTHLHLDAEATLARRVKPKKKKRQEASKNDIALEQSLVELAEELSKKAAKEKKPEEPNQKAVHEEKPEEIIPQLHPEQKAEEINPEPPKKPSSATKPSITPHTLSRGRADHKSLFSIFKYLYKNLLRIWGRKEPTATAVNNFSSIKKRKIQKHESLTPVRTPEPPAQTPKPPRKSKPEVKIHEFLNREYPRLPLNTKKFLSKYSEEAARKALIVGFNPTVKCSNGPSDRIKLVQHAVKNLEQYEETYQRIVRLGTAERCKHPILAAIKHKKHEYTDLKDWKLHEDKKGFCLEKLYKGVCIGAAIVISLSYGEIGWEGRLERFVGVNLPCLSHLTTRA